MSEAPDSARSHPPLDPHPPTEATQAPQHTRRRRGKSPCAREATEAVPRCSERSRGGSSPCSPCSPYGLRVAARGSGPGLSAALAPSCAPCQPEVVGTRGVPTLRPGAPSRRPGSNKGLPLGRRGWAASNTPRRRATSALTAASRPVASRTPEASGREPSRPFDQVRLLGAPGRTGIRKGGHISSRTGPRGNPLWQK